MDDKRGKAQKDIQKITSTEIQKKALILASLILTAFETLKYVLVDQPWGFFRKIIGFDSGKEVIEVSKVFKDELQEIRKDLPKSKRGNLLIEMAFWFKKHGVLTETDIGTVEQIQSYRNEVAHELLKYLVDSDFGVDINYLFKIREISEKVELWWIKEVHIPTCEEFDGVEVKDSDIHSPKIFLLDHFLSIALEMDEKYMKDKGRSVH
jgi:hypothetical protein